MLLLRGKGFRSLYSFVRTCTLTAMKCIVLAMLDVICIIDPVLVLILILVNIHSWYSRKRHFRCSRKGNSFIVLRYNSMLCVLNIRIASMLSCYASFRA